MATSSSSIENIQLHDSRSVPLSSCEVSSKKSSKIPKDVYVTDVMGESGRYQVLVASLTFWANIIAAWNVLGYTFFVYPMDYWCARPQEKAFVNLTSSEWKNLSVIPGTNVTAKCNMYEVSYDEQFTRTGKTIKCHHWEYYDHLYKETIVSKWDLVCDDQFKTVKSQTVYMIGFLLTVFVMGQISDKIGRRPVLLVCITVYLVAGLITTFAQSYIFFVILRFFVAIGIHGAATTSFVLLMEGLGSSFRPVYYLSQSIGWAVGYTTLPALAYFTRDWAYLQLSFVCFGVILLVIWWFLEESPRWLLIKCKVEAAESALIRIAKINRIWKDNSHELLKQLFITADKEDKNKHSGKATIINLVKTPNMRKKSFIMFYCWFVVAFVYYGISLNLQDFVGDLLVNTAIFGALEFVSAFTGFFCFKFVLRKPTFIVAMIIVATSCFGFMGIPDRLLGLRTAVAAISKVFIEMAFDLVYIYGAELFPTAVRNAGIGTSSTCGRIGSSVAPLMNSLIMQTNRSVPMAVFGSVTVLAGALVFLLPETKNKSLVDTVEEGEEFGK